MFSILAFYYLGPKNQSPIEFNVCLHYWDYNVETISFFEDLRVRWVRTDWLTLSGMLDYSKILQDNNINLLAIIDINTFNQTMPTLKEWNKTLTKIVLSEGFSYVNAVEIWNEPNVNASEYVAEYVDAYLDPITYFEMLKSAYSIIKNYTNVEVVFAGISPNIEPWKDYLLDVFSKPDIVDFFDIIGIHLYDDSKTNFETLNFIRNLTNKSIWVTETGYPSIDSQEDQANYLTSFYNDVYPLVDNVFIYEFLDASGISNKRENHFGLITINGTKKEAYNIVLELVR